MESSKNPTNFSHWDCQSTGGINPILLAGVSIFVLPVILGIFKIQSPKFITTIGVILIVIGIIISIYQALKAK